MPADKSGENKQLASWKEIASYLGVDERTCQRWEKKYGLPVRRMEDTPKSRVFAHKEDLDRWRDAVTKNNNFVREVQLASPAQKGESRPQNLIKRYIFYGIPVLIMAALLTIFLPRFFSDRQPVDFRIDHSTLIILNKLGRELWSYDTQIPNLWEEKEYREAFQRKKEISDEQRRLPVLFIKDIDHDGLNEVLFSTQTTDGLKADVLYCFDSKGTKLWEFKAGREIQLGSKVYSRDFVIIAVDIVDLNNDGVMEILVISHARQQIPTQVAVLNLRGSLIREYWNVGQFNDYAFEDLNGDGRKDILLAGQSNAYDRPCLVVLDFDSMKGISPTKPEMECPGLEKGSEKYYLLFALTELDKLFMPRIALGKIDILSNRRIQVRTTSSDVIYELNFLLNPEDVTLSDDFARRYRDAYREGKLRAPLDDKNKELIQIKLRNEIDYYDGINWTRGGAMSNKW